MSNYNIKIPDIGEGITEVELVEWFVKSGDTVAEDQPVASVMTEKVSVEISSPVSGTVVLLGGKAGDVLAVGADLIQIHLATDSAAVMAAPPLAATVDEPSTPSIDTSLASDAVTTAVAPRVDQQIVSNTTPHQRLLQKVQASPAVRKRAADLGLDLNELGQRFAKKQLTHADLDQLLAGGSTLPSATAIRTIPVVGLRRQIAKKMLESSQSIPHFSYIEALDVTEVEQWRQQLNQQWSDTRGHLTLLPFLIRAICLALTEHPAINARYNAIDDCLEQYTDINLAVATQTPDGLMVPVIQAAQHLSLWQLATAIRQLAQQAKDKTGTLGLKSTITLSSLGALGGVAATPIINAPEVAIVGVNKQVQQPVVIDGEIHIRTIMNLSSSFDHRFVDGLHAAEFIQEIRRIIESPYLYLIN